MLKKNLLLIALSSMCLSYAQESEITLKQLISNSFETKLYNQNVIDEYEKSMENLRDTPIIYEIIPGDIIGWTTRGAHSIRKNFRIVNDKLVPIEAIPSDNNFITSLTNKAPEIKERATDGSNWKSPSIIKESKNSTYILSSEISAHSSGSPYSPAPPPTTKIDYEVVYSTKDFKTFKLIGVKKYENRKLVK